MRSRQNKGRKFEHKIQKTIASGSLGGRNYKHGKYMKKYFCIDCHVSISPLHQRCYSCSSKQKVKLGLIVSGMKNKHHKNISKQKIRYSIVNKWKNKNYRKKQNDSHFNGKTLIKHHIFLKENSKKIIKIPANIHNKLHIRAYDFIYYKLGEEGIVDYLKWFDNKYGGIYE